MLGQGHGRFSVCVHSSLLGKEVKQKKFMDEKEKNKNKNNEKERGGGKEEEIKRIKGKKERKKSC